MTNIIYTVREIFLSPNDLDLAIRKYIEDKENVVFSAEYTIIHRIKPADPDHPKVLGTNVKIIYRES